MNKQVDTVFEGTLQASGLNIAVVCARFNGVFVSQLLDGAIDTIVRHGGSIDDVAVAWVPGSYEIPLVVNHFALQGTYDAIITLGVVIQGETPHAGYINSQVSRSLADISLKTKIPVVFGIITADTLEQAMVRSGTKAGNRGVSAAVTAIEMARLMESLNMASEGA